MEQSKSRHGCLWAYLIFMIVVNSFTSLAYLLMPGQIISAMPGATLPFIYVLAVLSLVNIVFSVALLKLKKWGFYGFCLIAIIVFPLNLMHGVSFVQSIFGLIGIPILFGVLHIGKENKGWPQLT
jgi:hypothetical protein